MTKKPGDVFSLVARRPPDPPDPTVLEGLRAFMAEVEAAPEHLRALALHWIEQRPGEREAPKVRYFGLTHSEAVALAALMVEMALDAWTVRDGPHERPEDQ